MHPAHDTSWHVRTAKILSFPGPSATHRASIELIDPDKEIL